MKNIFKITSILALALFGTLAFGQAALVQTTLASAVNAPGNGNSASYDTTVSLTSSTGVQSAFNGQPITVLYVGQEAMGVLSPIPGSTTIFNVLRGQYGTKVSGHPSGDMVLLGVVTPQFGGAQGSGGFQVTDPGFNSTCTPATTNQTPWINIQTQAQWLCSSTTNTWVPGFSNPYTSGGERTTATVASAAGAILPSGPLFEVSGALAITSFTIPVGFNATAVGGGQFCMIPTGAFTTTATNNIAKASTAVVGQILCETWDATQSKFVASY